MVKSHLKNTDEFINFLNSIENEIHGFCSLDVTNLYGSIPLEDINEKTPGIFTVAKRFFEKNKSDSCLSALTGDDFEALLRLCITSDTILIDGKSYSQKKGLAMGNNLAPTLAIIYMNELDELLLEKSYGTILLKRFIDDVFAALVSQDMDADKLLEISNGLNDAIKFTIEKPNLDNQLPFLDTLVSFDERTNKFSTELYIKPFHSQAIMPWDSHGPNSSKRALLVGEIRRAVACSTDAQSRTRSLRKITTIFKQNGYPKRFIQAVIRRTLSTIPNNDEQENIIYLKIPYVNEQLKRRALSVIRNSGISNIKTHFMNGRPSSKVFAPSREKLNCPDDCETCKLTLKANCCFTKHVVYQIVCSNCNITYIGETGRTVGSRIKEHLRMKKQTIFVHLKSHSDNPFEECPISWKILHSNIKSHSERKIIEALEIQKHSDNIMNGCIGRNICI